MVLPDESVVADRGATLLSSVNCVDVIVSRELTEPALVLPSKTMGPVETRPCSVGGGAPGTEDSVPTLEYVLASLMGPRFSVPTLDSPISLGGGAGGGGAALSISIEAI